MRTKKIAFVVGLTLVLGISVIMVLIGLVTMAHSACHGDQGAQVALGLCLLIFVGGGLVAWGIR